MAATGALLLDLDGTLVDSIPCWIEAYLETLQALDVRMAHDAFVTTIYQRGASVATVLDTLGITLPEPEFRRRRDERYVRLLGERVVWLPGAQAFLRAAPRPLGIVTNSWRIYVEAIDRCLGFTAHVDTVVDLEDAGARPKPHGHPLALAAARLGVEPARCVYVGDQAHDMVAARAAGMDAWLVPAPHTPAAAHAVADRVLPDLAGVAHAWGARGR